MTRFELHGYVMWGWLWGLNSLLSTFRKLLKPLKVAGGVIVDKFVLEWTGTSSQKQKKMLW